MTSPIMRVRDSQNCRANNNLLRDQSRVLVRMEHYSLILCRNRKSIVYTADLESLAAVKRAA